jgi:4-amino-4-deoxy-L-arabinose transferase-like glycosyltransferase
LQAVNAKSTAACYLLLLVAYVGGAFVPLMNNDSAHHANIALYIYQTGEWTRLVTQGQDYLDKPHLLFWLAALSFKVFGVNAFAYKLPSLLFSLLAVYATTRLGQLLHTVAVGRLAGVMLASALAFVLANNDVRMDALLTGSIMLATWQLAAFVASEEREQGRWRHLVLGGLGLALGFATKGMIGVGMPLIAIFVHLLYRRDWERFLDLRWLALVLITLAFASPVLYAYFQQFGERGVKFILWAQNVERLSGDRFGNAGADDPLFFFHSFLWAFLPWALLAIWALCSDGIRLVRARLQLLAGDELLTLGTIVVMFTVISLSRFKLPHYLNILLPFFAIQLAAWLMPRLAHPLSRKGLWWVQVVVIFVLALLAAALNGWVFPLYAPLLALVALVLAAGVWLIYRQAGGARLVMASVCAAAVFNLLLNFNFYPQLLTYQGGTVLGRQALALGLDRERLYYLADQGRANSFDFVTERLTPTLRLEEFSRFAAPVVVYTSANGRTALEEAGLAVEELARSVDFRVSRLNARFLDPARRAQTLETVYLLRVGRSGS